MGAGREAVESRACLVGCDSPRARRSLEPVAGVRPAVEAQGVHDGRIADAAPMAARGAGLERRAA
jgi:hypothetical protein